MRRNGTSMLSLPTPELFLIEHESNKTVLKVIEFRYRCFILRSQKSTKSEPHKRLNEVLRKFVEKMMN